MNRVLVDCTPVVDEHGQTVRPLPQVLALTQPEQAAYDAQQLLRVESSVAPHIAAGRTTVAVIDGVSKAVTFATALRSSDYVVTFNPTSSLSVVMWATNKTASGFTLNLSVAVSGTIEYIAHEVT